MNADQANLFAQAQSKYQAGELADAADLYQRVLSKDPTHADALHMLGVTAYQLGQVDAAADLLEQAVTVRQPFAEAESNLGTVLMALGRLEDAEAALRRAHDQAPDNPVILFNLGNALFDQTFEDQACTAYEQAVGLNPEYAEAWCQLGIAHRNADRVSDAMVAYERAIAANPNFSQALYNLANVYRDLDRFADAERMLRRAIDARPEYAMAWNSLGTLLGDMGRSDEALAAFDQAVLFAPESTPYASNRLCALQYVADTTEARLAEAHTEWYWLHIAPEIEPLPAPVRDRDPERTLKIGFISPDLGRHPVGFLSAPLFENIDASDIETTIFSTRPENLEDEVSRRIRAGCNSWIPASDLEDSALASRIDEHAIDILFDMSGQTSGNRLGVFARKPAPIQMSWIGYVGTTGLPAMDYVVSDNQQSPKDPGDHYCESIIRLPDGYVCYAPPEKAPEVGPLPALKTGHITFGCLNNPGKLNAKVIGCYASLLKSVDSSSLLFRFRGLDDPKVHEPIVSAFAQEGIDPDRLLFEGRASHLEFLTTYNRIDIALDTFPYSGGLTTCEALWMGVPTVTFPGNTFAGRHASTHLHTAGYADLVTQSPQAMNEKAVSLTADLDSLNDMRVGMRQKVANSPLCDGARFANNFSEAMRMAWNTWCATS